MPDTLCCFDRQKDTIDYLAFTALLFVLIGFAISTVGYVVPRNYTPNPALSAREAEALDLYYAELSNNLDICIIVGMSLIAVGGLLTSGIFMKTVVCADCRTESEEETHTLTQMDQSSEDRPAGYGAVGGTAAH